uniref:Major sperm protein n=1 Tax=Wuchereria bancrofti TaxID=6293 RepID=A0AAF5Q675_WUCBA
MNYGELPNHTFFQLPLPLLYHLLIARAPSTPLFSLSATHIMNSCRWLLFKLIFLSLTCSTPGKWMFVMDAKKENQWKQQTIPLWISPAYSRRRWEQLADLLFQVQNRTNIKFRSFIKERDNDYVSVKTTTYGCYGLLGYGKGGERWINIYDECIEYSHIVLRSIYQILGFQMIAMKEPEGNILYSGADSEIGYLKFVVWKDKFIVDSNKLTEEINEEECIGMETATSMMCHQPNMEFFYWSKVYENLIHSYPYVDDPLFGRVYRRTRNVSNHDIFHVNRIYKQANKDSNYRLHDFANPSMYRAEDFQKMPNVIIGLADLYCEDSLVDCDFLHKSRGHCNSFQEFRYILCARTCGMCGISLRLYYISTHHPFLYIQEKIEHQLPICTDDLQAVLNGTCSHTNLHNCLLPRFREKCRRSCGYCPEQSRVDCKFVTAVNAEYLYDHPNYNYRCQYIRAISNRKCEADEKVAINPITDCMLSCGHYACSRGDIEEDMGYGQVPVMQLYVPQKQWQFATLGSLASFEETNSSFTKRHRFVDRWSDTAGDHRSHAVCEWETDKKDKFGLVILSNTSNTKSKVTQSSASSNKSVKESNKLQKNKLRRSVEESSRLSSQKKRAIEKRPVSIRSQSDAILRSNDSDRWIGPWEKEMSGDTSANVPGKLSTVIPTVTTGTLKNMKVAKVEDGKSIFNEEMKEATFKEQEQNTQENIGLTDEKEEQELTLEPKNLRWNGEGGYQTVQLRNITKDRLAIKAKCSDNQLYRVNPVFGFIDPGEELKVDIMRRKAVPKVDKMIFVSVRANKDDIFPKPLFKRSKDSQKMAMLPLLIARAI